MDQDEVAAGKQELGVDVLEVIHIDDAEGQRAPIACSTAEFRSGHVFDGPAIEQLRERIGQGQFFQFLDPLLEFVLDFLQFLVLPLEFVVGLFQVPCAFGNALFQFLVELLQLPQQSFLTLLQATFLRGVAQDVAQFLQRHGLIR